MQVKPCHRGIWFACAICSKGQEVADATIKSGRSLVRMSMLALASGGTAWNVYLRWSAKASDYMITWQQLAMLLARCALHMKCFSLVSWGEVCQISLLQYSLMATKLG